MKNANNKRPKVPTGQLNFDGIPKKFINLVRGDCKRFNKSLVSMGEAILCEFYLKGHDERRAIASRFPNKIYGRKVS